MFSAVEGTFSARWVVVVSFIVLLHRSTRTLSLQSISLLRIVCEQLVDQINMRHKHSSTAVALEAEIIHGLTIFHAILDEVEILFVEIGYDLRYLSNGCT